MKSQKIQLKNSVDPFYLYLHLSTHLGAGNCFLLEAGRDDEQALYQMSLLGICPVVEIQVKDGIVAVFAEPELQQVLRGIDKPVDPKFSNVVWDSVVADSPLLYQPADPMQFLEQVRIILRDILAPDMTQPFSAGFLGYVGYDGIQYLEHLPQTTTDDRQLPDVRFQWHAGIVQFVGSMLQVFHQGNHDAVGRILARKSVSFDDIIRLLEQIALLGLETPTEISAGNHSVKPAEVSYDVTEEDYCKSVVRAKEYIRQGDIFQVVLSTRMRIHGGLHPYQAYDRLRRLNPSPYMFMVDYPGMRLYGASPEVQFRATDGVVQMKPIAGTSRGRGQSAEEDERMVLALKSNEKETAEHIMLVDLCRNDLGRVSHVGTVTVPDLMVVEKYSHLYHLVSRVEAKLRDDVSVFHALLATFPNGTLSGAPKIRAMEIIDELENIRRGPYGGFIGIVDAHANANTAIIIRSVVDIGDTQYVQVGAGIVLDSEPTLEWQECHHKAGAILDVLAGHSANQQLKSVAQK